MISGKGQTMNHYPRNAAVVVGQSVTLNCRTESRNSAWWKYERAGSKKDIILFNSKNSTESDCGNCSINNTEPGQNDFQISNIRLSNAGTYTCVENKDNSTNVSVSKTDWHAAELIVLASAPECGTNLTGSNASLLEDNDSVQMWCSVRFRGNIAPVMEWKNDKETISSRILIVPNNRVESEVIIQLKHDGIRGINYSCTTYFNQSFSDALSSRAIVARNTPDYRYTWTTEHISYWSSRGKEPAKRTDSSTSPPPKNELLLIWMIIPVVILLITLIIVCIFFLKRSNKGCFQQVSSVGSNVISNANIEGTPNIFYEDPRDHATIGQPPATDDHAYSLEPAQKAKHWRQQDLVPSTSHQASASTNAQTDGTPYEEVEVDLLKSINQSDERRPVEMHRPPFNVGTDGTVYAEVNMARGGHVSPTPSIQSQSLFSTSVYAQIDHTRQVLPPPPPTKRN